MKESSRYKVAHDAATSTCGAALGVAILDDDACEVWFAGVGNISAIVVGGGHRSHLASGLGIIGRKWDLVKESCLPWLKESIFVMHSDGFSERWDLNRYQVSPRKTQPFLQEFCIETLVGPMTIRR